jgi:hypothetical protein
MGKATTKTTTTKTNKTSGRKTKNATNGTKLKFEEDTSSTAKLALKAYRMTYDRLHPKKKKANA